MALSTFVGRNGVYQPVSGVFIAAVVTASNSDGTVNIATFPDGATAVQPVANVPNSNTGAVGAFTKH